MNKNLNNYAISSELYNWIRKNLPSGSTIIELGSGTGTIELCKHYTVYSVEHDQRFIGLAPSNLHGHKYKDFASKLRTFENRVKWLNKFIEPLGLEIQIAPKRKSGEEEK